MQPDVIPVRLAIDGFRVIASDERDDAVEVVIETELPAACCPDCGCATARAKERRSLWVRDIPLRPGKQTWLVWWKRRFACDRCGRTFTETHPEIPPRATHTRRFDRYLAARATHSPYTHVADEEGVTFYRIEMAARRDAEELLATRDQARPRRICIDESAHRRKQIYNTIVSDPDAPRVIDLIETRHRLPLERYLAGLPEDVKADIGEVVIDMWEPYRLALGAALPGTKIVADRFHTERLVSRALDETRRSVQNSVRRARGREPSSGQKRRLFYARHKLLKGSTRLTLADLDELAVLFEAHPQLHTAWELMWSFRRMYSAPTRAGAENRLQAWYEDVDEAGLRPFAVAATMIRKWEDEILAYFDSRLTNAYAEGMTNKIKVIKRSGYGFRTFANFRRRVLVACG
jgi:transposase